MDVNSKERRAENIGRNLVRDSRKDPTERIEFKRNIGRNMAERDSREDSTRERVGLRREERSSMVVVIVRVGQRRKETPSRREEISLKREDITRERDGTRSADTIREEVLMFTERFIRPSTFCNFETIRL